MVKPLQLKRGNTNVIVKNCSLDIPIGTFYICYSKTLSGLEKIEVDDQRCCYCSREGADDCMKRFPNWHLDYIDSPSKCYLTLLTVNDSDNGHYQCRIPYNICKLRYGYITNLSMYNPIPGNHKSSTSISSWIHNHVAITSVIALIIVIIVGVIPISTYCICTKSRSITIRSGSKYSYDNFASQIH